MGLCLVSLLISKILFKKEYYMKFIFKVVLPILILAMFFACTVDLDAPQPASSSLITAEEAFPGQTGEVYTGSAQINNVIKTIQYQKINGVNVFEGDIIIPESDINPDTGKACIMTNRTWPNNTVNYQIRNDVYNAAIIREAIAILQRNTNLNFVNSATGNYIQYIPDAGCWSYIGMIGGRQEIGIANWAVTGNVIHETMHALGVEHEHTRVDRDNTVTINWTNIQDGKSNNFTLSSAANHRDIGAFDFDSVMLYDSYAFSKNGQPTIVRRSNNSTFTSQRTHISIIDLFGLRALYPNRNVRLVSDSGNNTTGFGNVKLETGLGGDNRYYILLWSQANSGIRRWYRINYGTNPFQTWPYSGGAYGIGWPPNRPAMSDEYYYFDIDRDGDYDIFKLEESAARVWNVNLETTTNANYFRLLSVNTATTGYGKVKMEVGLGGDNRYYILLWSQGSSGVRRWYRINNGTNPFQTWPYSGGAYGIGWPPNRPNMEDAMQHFDIDNDGDFDRFILVETSANVWSVYLIRR
jgi:hypothetical protein